MNDKYNQPPAPVGAQIRRLRRAAGLTLDALARRAGTSAPTVHRYESGWDRFEVATLRRLAAALGARLEIRLTPSAPIDRPAKGRGRDRRLTPGRLARRLGPLFWDRELRADDVDRYPQWVLRRVLAFGDRRQVAGVRDYYGDEAVRTAAAHRSMDPRTRNYWRLMLADDASEGPQP